MSLFSSSLTICLVIIVKVNSLGLVNCDENIVGSGWQLVRHVPAGVGWNPTNDNLVGTSVYQTNQPSLSTSDPAWSIAFNNIQYNQYLFATGNCQYWLITGKNQIIPQRQDGYDAVICKSSINNYKYNSLWFNRLENSNGNDGQDPWISILGHPLYMLYGEKTSNPDRYNDLRDNNEGTNVYIRLITEYVDADECFSTDSPTNDPTKQPTNTPTLYVLIISIYISIVYAICMCHINIIMYK